MEPTTFQGVGSYTGKHPVTLSSLLSGDRLLAAGDPVASGLGGF